MEIYKDIRLTTDKYATQGVHKGDFGTIVEVFLNKKSPNNYLVEVYDQDTGIDKAIIVVEEGDIELKK